jgi:malate dehydrogenase
VKISIVGAGNVGGLTAMRIAQEGFSEIFLIDIARSLAQGKAFDLEDAQAVVKYNYRIRASGDMAQIKDSNIIVVTAGFARSPGMTREDLLSKNAQILKDICLNIKKFAAGSIVIVVTNPLDLMTLFTLKITGFEAHRVFGMGLSLDAARFANLIAGELNIAVSDITACVVGSHGEGMLPLPRLTTIKGIALDEIMDETKIESLIQKTFNRGKEIVSLLASGSAYFAPSAAIAEIVRVIAKDEKRTLGVSAYLNGEYGVQGICMGVPCRLGKAGIEEIIKLDLNNQEREAFCVAAEKLKQQYKNLMI